MADTFNLTPQPVRVSVATKQVVEQALDVSDYDEVDALAGIVGVEGSTSGVGLKLLTGMQRESTDGWVTLLTFTSGTLNGPNTYEAVNASTKLLKYIRWEVTGVGGASAITFTVCGMLRKRGL